MTAVETFPLTPAQHGMLVDCLRADRPGLYVEQVVGELEQPPCTETLRRAWRRVVARHPALRTSIHWQGRDTPVQTVHEGVDVPFDVREDDAGFLDRDKARGFDLTQAPLMRVTVLGRRCVWTVHHLVSDGTSFAIVFREVLACYDAWRAGREPELDEPCPFREHANWLEKRTDPLAPRFWRQMLEDAPAPARVAPLVPGDGAHASLDVSAAPLARFAAGAGLTLNTLVQGAWALFLAIHGGERDVVFGATRACRRSSVTGADRAVGLFVNTLPVRIRVRPQARLREWLLELRQVNLGIRVHEQTALADVSRHADRSVGEPLFASIVNFYPQDLDAAIAPQPEGRTFAYRDPVVAPLALTVRGGDSLALKLVCDPAQFDATAAKRMLRSYACVLEGLPECGEGVVADVPRGEPAVSRGVPGVPAPGCVHERCAAPSDSVALRAGDDAVDYATLHRRANGVAHHLATLGVRPGDRVALRMERGVDAVVAMLGVLKAGAAYVPLDPRFPPARNDLVLEDARAAAVLDAAGFGERDDAPLVSVTPDDPAYVVYTSGSTGRPKGVVVPHRAIVQRFADEAASVVLHHSPLAFDAATFEIWSPLLNGGTCVIHPESVPTAAGLATCGAERAFLTTALFNVVVDEDPAALAGLRCVLFGGERVSVPHVRRARRALPDTRLVHVYGPTEATTFATAYTVERVEHGTVPIGRPLRGTEARVLDETGRPVPVGAPGELCLGGAGLALGYQNGERFEGLYRTGDRVRLRDDQELEFLGRLDDQVKLRGFRVEPGEVAAVLEGHPGVREALVVARDGALVAYVVGETEDLRGWLRARLPDYMLPARIVRLERLPLGPTGKVDRAALPDPEVRPGSPPRTATEEVLAALWAELLDRESVGRDDDFFELGGHSLLATRMVSRIRDAFGVELAVSAILDAPTVADLARAIERARRPDAQPIRKTERPSASHAQRRLWFLDRLDPQTALYNVPAAMRLREAVDPAALERALNAVVARHDALRTRFVERDGQPEPVVEDVAVRLRVVESEDALREEARRPFDLAEGPLVRACLFERTLLATFHHVVFDGWSLDVFWRDLAASLAGEALAPLPVRYGDYAAWSNALDTDLAYWRERLRPPPPVLDLPADRPRPPVGSHRGARRPVSLGRGLLDLARKARATPFMAYLAAFEALLARYTGQRDICVGAPVANRSRRETEDLVGLFVNTLALRTDLSGDPTFLEIVGRVRETALGAYAHADAPFDRLVEEVRPERALSHAPLFTVFLDLQRPQVPALGTPVDIDTSTAKFDLNLVLTLREDDVSGWLEYATDLFDEATIDRLVEDLGRLADAAAEAPDTRLCELPCFDWPEPAPRSPYPETTLHALFEEQAKKTPDATAVDDWTYARLDRRANGVAWHLHPLPPEAPVAVCMDRSPEAIAGILGVLKAGGAYVPIDPADPRARPREGTHAVLEHADFGEEDAPPDVSLSPDNLAYVLYTSGSTGEPKGVMAPHRGAVNRLFWMYERFPFEAGEVCCQKTALTFVDSVWEIFGPLCRGVPLVVSDLVDLETTLVEKRVTRLVAVPSLLRQLATVDLPDLRYRTSSGEPCPPDLAAKVINLYGSSEVAGDVTCDVDGRGIGSAIANVEVLILDDDFNPAPVGEIFVGGDALARGYLGRPGLTAECFVPHPRTPGARLYRTGDRGRVRADGTIEFRGREDQQIKVRGFRVEPAEVEAALRGLPGVRECAVATRGGRLVAYVVVENGATGGDLAEGMRRRVPDYMVPEDYVVLDALPRNAHGKLDRRALPTPGRAPPRYEPPRGETEERLAALWRELLSIERLGRRDDFFDLGGHSLLGARVLARVRSELGADVAMRAIFEAPTLAGLAERIESAGRAAPEENDEAANGVVSFAQERLWFLEQLDPDTATLNVPVAARVRGPLDVERVHAALEACVARHETLRTSFPERDGRPFALVQKRGVLPLLVVEVEDMDDAHRKAGRDAARPFDLAKGSLVRAHLYRIADADFVLLVSMHHSVCDGWSLGVLLKDLAALYRGDELPPITLRYADHAKRQRKRDYARELEYWKARLTPLPPVLELPADHARPAVRSHRGGFLSMPLPRELRDGLWGLGRQEEATLFMVLLAGLQALLARLTGETDIAVGTPVANRDRAELEHLIGMFVDTLVLRTDVAGDPTFRDVVRRARATALGAFAHAEMPFEKLVSELRPPRDPSHTPLFQVLLVLQEPLASTELEPGLSLAPLALHSGASQYDLVVAFQEQDGELLLMLGWCEDLYERATVERLASNLRTLLEGAVADADAPLHALPLRARAVRVERAPVRRDACVHELFGEQVQKTPDEIAVGRMTYRELDRRANAVAWHLHPLAPEARVAICMDRSPDAIVAMLGVWKAGGAYTPVDPKLPQARIDFMLEGTAATLVHAFFGDKEEPPPARAHPLQLAYVLFTSGSTGRPKGVAMPHRPLLNLLGWQMRPARTLQFASLGFDVSFQEIFSTLLAGGTLVVAPEEARLDPKVLMELLGKERVERLFLPYAALQQLAELGEIPVDELYTAGEQLRMTPALARQRCRLYNQYGPTECHVVVTEHRVTERGGLPPIGKPLPNVSALILDADFQPVPHGVAGELFIGGEAVARGYLGAPGHTAERFVPSPVDGERLYRTGDRARVRADGRIEFLGRLDDQVKVRGFRVEPGEIEAALGQHPGVREAAVVQRNGRLVAYVAGEIEGLRDFLGKRLPEYMVPHVFQPVDALPKNQSGKIDRRALPQPAREGDAAPDLLTDEIEVAIAQVWETLLEIDGVGRDDDFFDLGGHSLLAVRMLARVEQLTGRRVPVVSLFKNATVAGVARMVRERAGPWPTRIEIRAGSSKEKPLFLVAAPHANALGYVFLARSLGGDRPVYALQERVKDPHMRPLAPEEVDRLATEYLEAMREARPKGPYALGGMCWGAHIAFEMARRLEAEGETVAPLVIFDTWPDETQLGRIGLTYWYWSRLREVARAGPRAQLSLFGQKLREAARRLATRVRRPAPKAGLPATTRLRGEVVLFRAEEQPPLLFRNAARGWARRAGGVRTAVVPGSHHMMLREPHVRALAAALDEELGPA